MADDIKTAIGSFHFPIASGDHDITIPGVTWTPKAAAFVVSQANVNGTLYSQGGLGMGACDGTREWSTACGSQDGAGTTKTRRRSDENYCMFIRHVQPASPKNYRASFVAFIAGGVRINVASGDEADDDYLCTLQIFGGADLEARAGSVLSSATIGGTVSETTSFETNLLLTSAVHSTTPNSSANDVRIGFGFGAYDGTTIRQGAACFFSANGSGTSNNSGKVNDDRVIMSPSNSLGLFREVELTDVDATSFELTTRHNAQTLQVFYLALHTGDRKTWAGVLDSPTSAASDWDVTAIGFKPQLVNAVLTNVTALDTRQTSGAAAEYVALSAFTAIADFCGGYSSEDAAVTSRERASHADEAIRTYDGVSTLMHRMNSPTMEINGFKFAAANIDNADAIVRKWPFAAIEEVGAAPSFNPALARMANRGNGFEHLA